MQGQLVSSANLSYVRNSFVNQLICVKNFISLNWFLTNLLKHTSTQQSDELPTSRWRSCPSWRKCARVQCCERSSRTWDTHCRHLCSWTAASNWWDRHSSNSRAQSRRVLREKILRDSTSFAQHWRLTVILLFALRKPNLTHQNDSKDSENFRHSCDSTLLLNNNDWRFPTRANLYIKISEQQPLLCKRAEKRHQSIARSARMRDKNRLPKVVYALSGGGVKSRKQKLWRK